MDAQEDYLFEMSRVRADVDPPPISHVNFTAIDPGADGKVSAFDDRWQHVQPTSVSISHRFSIRSTWSWSIDGYVYYCF
jgi:hypothetical protein